MTTITLDANLDTQIQSVAKQARASVDEIVNDILAKYFTQNNDSADWKAQLGSMPNVGEDKDFDRSTDYGREQTWDF